MGGTANDTFTIDNNSSVSGLINGGGGTDTLNYSADKNSVVVNLQTGSASSTGGIAGISTLVGNNSNTTLVGANAANTWMITGANTGNVNGALQFSGVTNLTGGTGSDTFTPSGSGSLSGTVDGGAGANTLDFSLYGKGVTVNLATGAAPGLNGGLSGGFAHIQTFVGNQGTSNNKLIGPASATTYTLTSATAGALSSGQTFSNFQILAGSGSDSLLGPNVDTAWVIQGANTGNLTAGGVSTTFSGMKNVTGGSGNDSFQFLAGSKLSGNLDGGAGSNTLDYSLYGKGVTVNLGTGSATAVAVVKNIQTVVGSPDADSLTGDAHNDTLAAGGGADTLAAGSGGGNHTFILAATQATGTTITGGSGSDTLVGPDTTNTWIVNGSGSGTVDGWSFKSVANLIGGSGNDTFKFSGSGSLSGTIDGGAGANTLDYSKYSSNVLVALATGAASAVNGGKAGGFANIESFVGSSTASKSTLVGPASATTYTLSTATSGSLSSGQTFTNFNALTGSGSDTLIGPNVASAWIVTGPNSGTLTAGGVSLTFSGMENVTGGSGNDSFQLLAGSSLAGTLDGGLGSNTLDYSKFGKGVTVNLGTGSATAVASVANILTVTGSPFADSLTGDGNNDTLVAGGGADTLAAGSGGGNHNFILAATQATGTTITGGSGSDSLVGPNAANTWVVSGSNSGTIDGWSFKSVANLTGGSGSDTFKFSGSGSLSGTIDGGAGANTLDYSQYGSGVTVNLALGTASGLNGDFTHIQTFVGNQGTSNNQLIGPASATTYTLKSATAGSLSSGQTFSNFQILAGSGSDSLIGPNLASNWVMTGANSGTLTAGGVSTTFSGMQNVTGGSGNDSFQFLAGSSLSGKLDGGLGSNWLDYSTLLTGVTVNLTTGKASNVTGAVLDIQNVLGSAGNDNLTGSSSGGVLVGNGGNDLIQGGAGRSILIGGLGNDTVRGGSADDIVIGGRTTYDNNEAALLSLLGEWQNTNDSYATRISKLEAGVGPSNVDKLIWGSTVLDDGGKNVLTGDETTPLAGSLDWFFANLAAGHDTITDLTTGEKVND